MLYIVQLDFQLHHLKVASIPKHCISISDIASEISNCHVHHVHRYIYDIYIIYIV